MSFEAFQGFDDWDEKFLDQAIRLEEEVLSCRNATQAATPAPVPPPGRSAACWTAGFSPPRELSQRPGSISWPENEREVAGPLRGPLTTGGWSGKDSEVERLKRELGRVSKQLNHLQHECLELKKERDRKNEQLKNALSQIEAKNDEINNLKRTGIDNEAMQGHGVPACASTAIGQVGASYSVSEAESLRSTCLANKSHARGITKKDVQAETCPATSELNRRILIDNATTSNGCSIQQVVPPGTAAERKSTKARGVQTDLVEKTCGHILVKDESSLPDDITEKLQEIWDSPSGTISRKDRVSELFATCASEFYELFRCMSNSSRITVDCLRDQQFSEVLHEEVKSVQSIKVANISQLFSRLKEINNGMAQLDTLLEVLIDLCVLEKGDVVYRSLCTLRVLLQHMMSSCAGVSKRDNVVITHSHNSDTLEDKSKNCVSDRISGVHNVEKVRTGPRFSGEHYQKPIEDLLSFSSGTFDISNCFATGHGSSMDETVLSQAYLLSVFDKMLQVTARNNEERTRVEAVNIMNLVLLRSNPNSEREQFGSIAVFNSLTWLLKKEVGVLVQMHALRLLFSLLNCPKLLTKFCVDHEDVEPMVQLDSGKTSFLPLQRTGQILEGLGQCLACTGSGAEGLKLRRQAIIVLAFIASSGRSGFELLFNLSSSNGGMNFLELIVRVLVSEIDSEKEGTADAHEPSKERTLLLREALILLNRLASNPVYSRSVLGVLTRGRPMTNLTIDLVDKISRKGRAFLKTQGNNKVRSKEAEIVDLAQAFRMRVFTFLGHKIS